MNEYPITFIIPCYNCSETLRAAIDSILNLNLENYEICAIDDCSTDDTFSILEGYVRSYPSVIKIGRHEENQGGAITRNDCVKMSKFQWIFCLDSDNILHKNSFIKLYSKIKQGDSILSFGEMYFFMTVLFYKFVFKRWVYLKEFMEFDDLRISTHNPVASGNYLFTRELFDKIGGYETDLGALDAYSFGYKALYSGFKIKLIKDTWYFHRLSLNSYWMRENNNNNGNFKKLFARFPNKFTSNELSSFNENIDVNNVLINSKDTFALVIQNPLFSLISFVKSKLYPVSK